MTSCGLLYIRFTRICTVRLCLSLRECPKNHKAEHPQLSSGYISPAALKVCRHRVYKVQGNLKTQNLIHSKDPCTLLSYTWKYIKRITAHLRTSGAWLAVRQCLGHCTVQPDIWVLVNIMVPSWIPTVIWYLIFRVPQKGSEF